MESGIQHAHFEKGLPIFNGEVKTNGLARADSYFLGNADSLGVSRLHGLPATCSTTSFFVTLRILHRPLQSVGQILFSFSAAASIAAAVVVSSSHLQNISLVTVTSLAASPSIMYSPPISHSL